MKMKVSPPVPEKEEEYVEAAVPRSTPTLDHLVKGFQLFKTAFDFFWDITQASQVVLGVKNLPVNAADPGVKGLIPGSGRSPGEENVIDSSILSWEIPWTEEPDGLHAVIKRRT